MALALLIGSQEAVFAQPAAPEFTQSEAGERYAGGRGTHLKRVDKRAFMHPTSNLPFKQQLDFRVGQGIFKKLWVTAPTATTASDGLGPLYNARACRQCHIGNGRGHPPKTNWPDDNAVSMFLRLSIPPQNEEQKRLLAERKIGVIPEPIYGGQLQDFAVPGLPGEGRMTISYRETPVTLADGTTVSLRKPTYSITEPAYGPLHPQLMISPRVAPPMIGLGLLEAIDSKAILAREDRDDRNNDGISGRANRVWNGDKQQVDIGRYGWKAGHATLNQQNNSALNGDIGISNPAFQNPYGDCTEQQSDCLQMPNGNTDRHDNLEASRQMTDAMLLYTRNLAVPARRNVDDPQVLAGKKVFYDSGCESCHRAKFVIADDPSEPQNRAPQLIWPYSDLLLHDMGEGLADGRPEYAANGHEWRTPPLWGIGLTETVSGHTYFLHDGRARNLLEAILWHGGEAQTARNAVVQLPTAQRNNLIRFLESL
ncbi:di-heme oxidoredictase family protein [Pontibacterium granulatum]|uniref:di-heme oxidoreductase family protein n=1 Tax=Pontibacterium granulatum TaxID=2036029 RepID=UPI00249A6701|nr:di-heme oxidoredictase family protein [Pontibacterium granulatum]MDI3324215.1 di-heme oxidoredictase family protein [Pontibacterium granulatum]